MASKGFSRGLVTETDITEIMTVDAADFSCYRLPDWRPFVLL
jgi:hypothetical protein